MMRQCSTVVLFVLALPAWAQPRPETVKAFDRYLATAETRIRAEQESTSSFLQVTDQKAEARLRRGEVLIEKMDQTPAEVSGGLIHDWVGTVFLPGASVAQVIAFVRDYNHTAQHYQPEVEASRLLSHTGDDFRVFMRLRKHKIVTVVLDTGYDVHYGRLDADHWFSTSHSTRIDEVGGGDHGFLSRLNTYWRFVQVVDGVIVQCEAISLTRDIPSGLGWMIGPFVTSIPRESLEFTMTATRKAVSRAVSQSVSNNVKRPTD